MIQDGDRDLMMREFFRRVAGYDDDAIDELTRSPLWEARRRVTPTLPRELRAELAHRLDPDALAAITAPDAPARGHREPRAGPCAPPRPTAEALPNADECGCCEGQRSRRQHRRPGAPGWELETFLAEVSSGP